MSFARSASIGLLLRIEALQNRAAIHIRRRDRAENEARRRDIRLGADERIDVLRIDAHAAACRP